MAVEAARFRCLGQGDEERGLTVGKVLWLFAEELERRGAHAFDASAERRQCKVQAQNLALGQ